jgi:hypothetical protein
VIVSKLVNHTLMAVSPPVDSGSIVSNVLTNATKTEIVIGISPQQLWDSIKEVPIDTLFVSCFCLVIGLLFSIGVEKLGRLLYNYIARSILMLFMTVSFTVWLMQSPIGEFLIRHVRISSIVLTMLGFMVNNTATPPSPATPSPLSTEPPILENKNDPF